MYPYEVFIINFIYILIYINLINGDFLFDRFRDFPQLTRFLDLDCSKDADDEYVDPHTKLQRQREREATS